MRLKYDPEIRLNTFGDPDIDFYIKEAKRLRAETCAALFHDIVARLKKTVSRGHGLPMRTAH